MTGEPVTKENDEQDRPFAISNAEYVDLEDETQDRLIEYNQSVQGVEAAKGRRLLFERAPSETLPFIVYCLYVSGNALAVLFVLFNFDGTKWPVFLLIGIAIFAPLLTLPSGSFTDVYSWLLDYLQFWRR